MSTDYSYDDEGQFFPFFFITVGALVTVPITYNVLKQSRGLENTAPRISTSYQTDHADLVENVQKQQRRKELKIKRMVACVIGWTIILLNIYFVTQRPPSSAQIWDPYSILDVPMGATERQVQSRYRRLSITMHPDKAQPDASKNETMETVNDRWVEIIKAYKTLTDEDVRANWEQYGNPDGKQSTSFGIALPKFLVAEGNGKYIMVIYAALLGVLLPYLVGSWWYGSQSMTREKVLVTSAGKLFREYSERITENGIVGALSSGSEFADVLKGHRADAGLGQVEKRILARENDGAAAVSGMTVKDQDKLKDLDDGTRRKVLALLWAYLGRVELDDPTLETEKYEIAPPALMLNEAFLNLSLAYGFTIPVLGSYRVSQSLVQAVPPNSPPLLQLPYFTRAAIKTIEEGATSSYGRNMTVQSFMEIADTRRRELTSQAGISSAQYDAAIKVANQLPRLVIERTQFKVAGEKYVLPSSLVQLVIKARFIPPGTTDIPKVDPSELEDDDADETDPKVRRELEAEKKTYQPPLAFAPYFARDRAPRWHLFLADSRQGKIAVPPFTFSTFSKPIVTDDGKPTFNVQTLKMTFQAPPQQGVFKFQMNLVCDSYLGFDDKREVVMTVDDPAKAEEVLEEDEISEPEEDSLAGQMAALKGQGQGQGSWGKTKRRKVVDSDDSGSDTDADVESTSETDTDTDTDDE